MTATLTTTANAIESAVGKLKLNGTANGHTNGHADVHSTGHANGPANGGDRKNEAQLVDPFNYVVSCRDLCVTRLIEGRVFRSH